MDWPNETNKWGVVIARGPPRYRDMMRRPAGLPQPQLTEGLVALALSETR